ncbi:MAG: ADP-ribosylglycohydrolase family protein [bacterium]|nr:ADP-ribosylglycohydrolase family protein [bacterium]
MQREYLSYYWRLRTEVLQSQDEGKDISVLKEEIEKALEEKDGNKREELAKELLDKLQALPVKEDFKYVEPSNFDEILKESDEEFKSFKEDITPSEKLFDKVYGAWLGRIAGCLLGKPVEGWPRDKIWEFLEETDNFPLSRYMSSDLPKEIKEKYGIIDHRARGWINLVNRMVEDDDTNYTILGLYILERYGPDFSSEDVGESWLYNIPIFHTYTAERVAYQNLVNLIMPPKSGEFRNPYREWIGAQIRADFWGYISPGDVLKAGKFAYRDACVSHVKNGIYGEMFISACLAWAFVSDSIEDIIKAGLSVVPKKSRFYEAVNKILDYKKAGKTFEDVREYIYQTYEKNKKHEEYWHNWCHVISNALVVVSSLLYSNLDYEKGITYAVSCGLDTDCNGATTGSILGAIIGAKNLPEKWIKPINDEVESGVSGYNLCKVSELAKRTMELIRESS